MKSKLFASFLLLAFVFTSGAWAGWASQESTTSQNLNAIYIVSEAIGLAAGASGTAVKTANGGTTWAAKTSGTTLEINDVLFPSLSEGYLLANSGTLKKSTNGGESFADFLSLPTEVASAEFRGGSFLGADRAFVAYEDLPPGGTPSSYILRSTDSGSSWLITNTLVNLNADGVHLSTGETWVWGRDNSSGRNVIWKGTTEVWSDATNAVYDLIMVDSNTGYAVGSNGLILKTTLGGDSGEWTAISSGTSNDLNAVLFLTADFGWAAGESGTIILTATGGTTWSAYTLDEPTTEVNDISVYVQSAGVATSIVHAFVCGSNGKIYKLASPKISSVTPEAASQGFIGTVEVSGSGFLSGAQVNFRRAGQTDADPDITVVATTYESASKLIATLIISAEATIGLRDVAVVNTDATTSVEASAFSVTTAEAVVRNIWIGTQSSRTKYSSYWRTAQNLTIPTNPYISFEGYSLAGLSPSSVDARIVARQNGTFTFFSIPASDMTAVSTQEIRFNTNVVTGLPEGRDVALFIFIRDQANSAGADRMNVKVATSEVSPSTPPQPGSNTGSGAALPTKPLVNLLKEGATIQFRPQEDSAVNNIRVILTNWKGTKLWDKTFNTTGILNKYNINIPAAELPHNLSAGIYTVLVFNADNMNLLAKNKLVCVPWQ